MTKCQKDPICGIFLKRGLFKGIKNEVSMCQTRKYKNTNTQIRHLTKCLKDPTCGIFLKRGEFKDIKNYIQGECFPLRDFFTSGSIAFKSCFQIFRNHSSSQVDRHCSPFSKLLKAARNGQVERIIKRKLEKLKNWKTEKLAKMKRTSQRQLSPEDQRFLDLIINNNINIDNINLLPGICFSGASTALSRVNEV